MTEEEACFRVRLNILTLTVSCLPEKNSHGNLKATVDLDIFPSLNLIFIWSKIRNL